MCFRLTGATGAVIGHRYTFGMRLFLVALTGLLTLGTRIEAAGEPLVPAGYEVEKTLDAVIGFPGQTESASGTLHLLRPVPRRGIFSFLDAWPSGPILRFVPKGAREGEWRSIPSSLVPVVLGYLDKTPVNLPDDTRRAILTGIELDIVRVESESMFFDERTGAHSTAKTYTEQVERAKGYYEIVTPDARGATRRNDPSAAASPRRRAIVAFEDVARVRPAKAPTPSACLGWFGFLRRRSP